VLIRMTANPAGHLALCSALRLADAARDLFLARCLALFRSVALIDVAGEPIDKPSRFIGWALKPNVSSSDRRYQRGQQNACTNDRRADYRWHRRRRGTPVISISWIFTLSSLMFVHSIISSRSFRSFVADIVPNFFANFMASSASSATSRRNRADVMNLRFSA
jgi:hypothetical protein